MYQSLGHPDWFYGERDGYTPSKIAMDVAQKVVGRDKAIALYAVTICCQKNDLSEAARNSDM